MLFREGRDTRCTQSVQAANLFLNCNIFRKSQPVQLPDVVADQNQDKIILEKLEEENLRLKAIFKLHSIKLGDVGEARRRSSSGSRLSSISSESSSTSLQSNKVFC